MIPGDRAGEGNARLYQVELAANAAMENYRPRFNRVFDVGGDGLYRKGLRFKQRPAA
jgi:hypothetical protein